MKKSDGQLLLDLPANLRFRVAPRTMQMLGRDSISSATTAVVELVKNAYDADATQVKVDFTYKDAALILTVTDNGVGMSISDLRNKWMVISTDNKRRAPLTKRRRVKVGEKGIGRLVLDRLAEASWVTTFQSNSYPDAIELFIDWSRYEQQRGELTKIKHPLTVRTVDLPYKSGTILRLERLRDPWTEEEFRHLQRSLSLLVPPFSVAAADFQIEFVCEPFPELSGIVQSPVSDAAELVLTTRLTQNHVIRHELKFRDGSKLKDEVLWSEAFTDEKDSVPSCGPVESTILFFLRDRGSLKESPLSSREIGDFLERYQGVRIYRDGFWVKPYGQPGDAHDWLGLNARRVSSPGAVTTTGYRVGGNQVVGAVNISRRKNKTLEDRANREGLKENEAFYDLRKLLIHGIQFLERERRKQAREEKKKSNTKGISENVEQSREVAGKAKLTAAATLKSIEASPLFTQEEVGGLQEVLDFLEEIDSRLNEAAGELEDEQSEKQLMMGLATTGIAMVAFGHETLHPIQSILNRTSIIQKDIEILDFPYKEQLQDQMNVIELAGERIRIWSSYALNSVTKDRRTMKTISINEVARDTLDSFAQMFEQKGITIEFVPEPSLPKVRAFHMDIEAILVNFITNAVEALRHVPKAHRKLRVCTFVETPNIVFSVADSGRGIPKSNLGKIFDPMFSTRMDANKRQIGTGLGLTIVKSLVDGMKGSVSVEPASACGGAEFTVRLPIKSK